MSPQEQLVSACSGISCPLKQQARVDSGHRHRRLATPSVRVLTFRDIMQKRCKRSGAISADYERHRRALSSSQNVRPHRPAEPVPPLLDAAMAWNIQLPSKVSGEKPHSSLTVIKLWNIEHQYRDQQQPDQTISFCVL